VITISQVKVFSDKKNIILTNNDNKIIKKMNVGQAKNLVEKLVTAIEERK
jgi:hypothetical protein